MVSIFRGDYSFLSNLYSSEIDTGGRFVYKSAEHLYQATKCSSNEDRAKIRNAETPKSAKIIGRFVKTRRHWDVYKVNAMVGILRLKFKTKKLKRLLRATRGMQLTNQNYLHDTFWGVCGCTKHKRTGLNMLGKILMFVRDENG